MEKYVFHIFTEDVFFEKVMFYLNEDERSDKSKKMLR